jgi:hypothetical protein
MFKQGDRVRYVGGTEGFGRNNNPKDVGTVREATTQSNIVVKWDAGSRRGSGGVYGSNLELVGIEVGDRVRYVGRTVGGAPAYCTGAEGIVTALTTYEGTPSANVEWDARKCAPDPSYLTSLEIIVPKLIDTTKPLTLPGSERKVIFVTETSDGNILVDVTGYGWAVFDKQGKFVRAKDGYGYSLGLQNKVERTVGYQPIRTGYTDGERVGASVYNSFDQLKRESARDNRSDAALKITRENGRIIAAELVTSD